MLLFNYLKIAYRIILNTRLYSIINILGLSIGMTACLIILHYVSFEKSYDKFHENYDRIYRIRYERFSEDGESVRFASCCPPVGLRIRASLPDAEKVARIFHYLVSVSYDEKRFIEERLYFAEPEFFEIFDFKFAEGDPNKGIREPNAALISKTTAGKYFGDTNPLGKSIRLDNKWEYKIVGVFEDIPENSHIKFDIVLPWMGLLNMLGQDYDDSWGDSGAFTYVLFRKGVNIDEFQKKLNFIADQEFGEVLRTYKLTMKLPLQKLTDIHLTSHFQQEFEANGDLSTVNLLFAIAIFIIVIAWVNYINLSTAQSFTRAKETGLRKVIGASRFNLRVQFFLEVVMINILALSLTLVMLDLVLPMFSSITGTPLSYDIWYQNWLWPALCLLLLAGVFLSGLYPVTMLSSFSPLHILKGKPGNKPGGLNLRKVLVIFQFSMAIGLITFTFAVFRQVSYLKKQKLGFSIDQVYVVRAPRIRDASFTSRVESFRQEVLKNASIADMCVLTEVPGRQIYWDAGGIHPVGSDESKNYQIVGIDYSFVDFFKTKIIEGRNFSKEFSSDSLALILNETAVKWMGFQDAQSAVGKKIDYWGDIFTVVGIMKDFHQQSPKAAFEPHIYRLLPYGRGARGMFAFRLGVNDPAPSLIQIQRLYNKFFPDNPFESFFLDEYYYQQYKADLMVGKILGVFSFLAIFITALGIYGLFSFLAIQRVKEICIRSIMGAGFSKILLVFIRELLVLILISFLIALSLCYVIIDRWLESYAIRMNMNVSLFILPLILVILIVGLTLSSQIIRITRINPVENLRYE